MFSLSNLTVSNTKRAEKHCVAQVYRFNFSLTKYSKLKYWIAHSLWVHRVFKFWNIISMAGDTFSKSERERRESNLESWDEISRFRFLFPCLNVLCFLNILILKCIKSREDNIFSSVVSWNVHLKLVVERYRFLHFSHVQYNVFFLFSALTFS